MRTANRETPPGRRLVAAGTAALLALVLAVCFAAWASMRASEPPAPEEAADGAAGPAEEVAPSDEDPGHGEDEGALGQGIGVGEGTEQAGDVAGSGQEEQGPSEGRLWAQSIEGGDRLAGYSDAQLDELEARLWEWMDANGWAAFEDPSLVGCAMGPEQVEGDPAISSRVWFRLKGTRTYVQADWFGEAGQWRVAKLVGTVAGLNDADEAVAGVAGEVELADVKSMRAVLGQGPADALDATWRELYGHGGRPGIAYVYPGEVERTDSGISLVIRYAAGDGADDPVTIETEASWDAASGSWSLTDVPIGS